MIARRTLCALALASLAAPSRAQASYPTRTVRVIVPSAPGDGGDSIARLYAHHLERRLGQSFVVENRTGAGGRIGTEVAVRAAPDGYTLVMGNAGSHGINAALYRSLPYDIASDFAPISLLVEAPNVLVVNRAKLPVKDVAELIAYAQRRPGEIAYASGGPGTSAHLTMELFRSLAGVDLQHVPFRGAVPALQALVSGEPPVMFVTLPPRDGLHPTRRARRACRHLARAHARPAGRAHGRRERPARVRDDRLVRSPCTSGHAATGD